MPFPDKREGQSQPGVSQTGMQETGTWGRKLTWPGRGDEDRRGRRDVSRLRRWGSGRQVWAGGRGRGSARRTHGVRRLLISLSDLLPGFFQACVSFRGAVAHRRVNGPMPPRQVGTHAGSDGQGSTGSTSCLPPTPAPGEAPECVSGLTREAQDRGDLASVLSRARP